MEKAAADGILERDTGPIEPHLEALATSREVPGYAVAMCTLRIEEAAPALRAVVERAAAGQELSFDEGTLLLRGLYILGGARDQTSFQPLLRLLRRPGDELDKLLGDVITDGVQRIAAGTFDGDTEGLLACVSERGVDEFARHALLGAATFLAWNGKIDRDRFQRFLVDFHDGPLAEDDAYVWIAWLMAIGLLGLRDLAPMAKKAWDDGRIPEGAMEWRHFDQDLRDAERAPDDIERFDGNGLGYIEDTLEAMDWMATEDEDLSSSVARSPGRGYVPDQPIINPNRGVGRNGPCPCGSGKKYKKCCLGT